MDIDLPPSESDPPSQSGTLFPWSLDFLRHASPPSECPPTTMGQQSPGPAPRWAVALWHLSSPHAAAAVSGSSAFSVDVAAIAYLLHRFRSHSFAHGILKGRVKESRSMFKARVSGAWRAVGRRDGLSSVLFLIARRLSSGTPIGVSDLDGDDIAFYRAVCAYDIEVQAWHRLRSSPTALEEVLSAVAVLTESLKEPTHVE